MNNHKRTNKRKLAGARGRIAHATTHMGHALVPPRGAWWGFRLEEVVVVVVVVVVDVVVVVVVVVQYSTVRP